MEIVSVVVGSSGENGLAWQGLQNQNSPASDNDGISLTISGVRPCQWSQNHFRHLSHCARITY